MDEPLSNLDAKLRNQMRSEILKLRQKVNTSRSPSFTGWEFTSPASSRADFSGDSSTRRPLTRCVLKSSSCARR